MEWFARSFRLRQLGCFCCDAQSCLRCHPTHAWAVDEEWGVTLGEVVGTFKSMTTEWYAIAVRSKGWPSFDRRLWQCNDYEHIICDRAALENIRQYIINILSIIHPPEKKIDCTPPDPCRGTSRGCPHPCVPHKDLSLRSPNVRDPAIDEDVGWAS